MADGGAPDRSAGREAAGRLLVALQFGLLAALGGRALVPAAAPGAATLALLGVAVVLGLWALAANRPGNFNIRPAPRAGGHLVTRGPYRWIRHPMYTALLLATLAAALHAGGALDAALWAALLAVLGAKAGLEERALLLHHPGYAAYRAGTKRFLPGLF